MIKQGPRWNLSESQPQNPNQMTIHYPAEGHGRTVTIDSKAKRLRTGVFERDSATIEDVTETFPAAAPEKKWIVRMSYPPTEAIALGDDDSDVNGIPENARDLPYGMQVRRDGAMLEFMGPPSNDVPISLSYHDRTIRLRFCANYIIVEERIRFDVNGVAEIDVNEGELQSIPEWDIPFIGADFAATRLRFGESRARLEEIDGKLSLKDLGRVVN